CKLQSFIASLSGINSATNNEDNCVHDASELKTILDSRIPLLVIETFEEKKALDVLLQVANQLGKDLHRWTITEGLIRLNFGPQLVPHGAQQTEPETALKHIKEQYQPGIYVLCDLHPYL